MASLREGLLEDTTYINNCQSSGDAFIRVQKAAYALGLGTQQVLLYVHTESRCMYCLYIEYSHRVLYN